MFRGSASRSAVPIAAQGNVCRAERFEAHAERGSGSGSRNRLGANGCFGKWNDPLRAVDSLGMVPSMAQTGQERPWVPARGAPGMVLMNPEGTRHLSFDMAQGAWFRLLENAPPSPLSVSEAILLRPIDAGTMSQWS